MRVVQHVTHHSCWDRVICVRPGQQPTVHRCQCHRVSTFWASRRADEADRPDSVDWSNFLGARSQHGNIDLQTVGELPRTDAHPVIQLMVLPDLNQPLPFESGYFGEHHLLLS